MDVITTINKLGLLNPKEKYSVNNKTKCLFNIEDGKITPSMLSKAIYEYVKSNNLLEGKMYRVDTKLSEALNLSPQQIYNINNATSTKDIGCMSFYNCMSFIINCFEL
jgi:hypothetical protein